MRNLPEDDSEVQATDQTDEISARTEDNNALTRFLGDAKGTASLEYGLIAAGIAIAVLAGVQSVGSELTELYQSIATGIYTLR